MEEIKEGKLSYEQLEAFANQLSNRNKELVEALNSYAQGFALKRIEFLLSVINSGKFPEAYVDECIQEVMESMRIPEESK